MADFRETPNNIPWPPILFLGALLAANILQALVPVPLPGWISLLQPLGWFLCVVAVGLMLWAFLAFRQHNTNVLPNKAADLLITTGPFSFSRNPIYLSEAILLTGLAIANGSIWYASAVPVFMMAVTHLAIEREETHLAARFADTWAAYSLAVRRWL